jgi:hypothetical protein
VEPKGEFVMVLGGKEPEDKKKKKYNDSDDE